MCGIFAYINCNVRRDRNHILEVLFSGLHRLEHRGCDSCGIAIDSDDLSPSVEGKSPSRIPVIFRQEGKTDRLAEHVFKEAGSMGLLLEETFHTHVGIAHTRWATHGSPSARNSHPQSSGEGNEFLVIHNGVITNHTELKEPLVHRGFKFESETDTEVIPKLAKLAFDELLGQNSCSAQGKQLVTFSQVVSEVLCRIKGACALIFKSLHFPNQLIAYNYGSSLLLGINEFDEPQNNHVSYHDSTGLMLNGHPKELFFSSDKSAIVDHTNKVLVIENNELVHIKDGNISIVKYDISKGRVDTDLAECALVKRTLLSLDMEVERISKGCYEHFMQKEIYEQPESLATTMRGRLIQGEHKAKNISFGGLKDHVERIRGSRRIVLVGCGTSYNAALASRPILEELSGIPVTMEVASDLVDRHGPIFREDTVIFISQSGETADTLVALEYASKAGALCIGITNTVCSALARQVHCGVYLNAGPEIGVASTKAYTSQIVVMTMLALVVGVERESNQSRRDAIIDGLFDLPGRVQEVLKLDEEIKELARLLMEKKSLLMFGRSHNYATALEGALKVKEIALMHSEGMLAGEMKHGPLALVDETLPIIVIATHDDSFSKQQLVIQQLLARKGHLIVICSKGHTPLACASEIHHIIEVPEVEDCLQPVINIVPLQLLAYHLTILRKLNVDQPRNLAKSVTTQ